MFILVIPLYNVGTLLPLQKTKQTKNFFNVKRDKIYFMDEYGKKFLGERGI